MHNIYLGKKNFCIKCARKMNPGTDQINWNYDDYLTRPGSGQGYYSTSMYHIYPEFSSYSITQYTRATIQTTEYFIILNILL